MYMPIILLKVGQKVGKMEFIIYFFIYIIGVVLGSFFTLAVHRIPRKEDITHTRSYCPNCNHRLNFWDLIPVLSYIFLGGKCRYCHKKIRPRYLIIEAISGMVFLLFVMCLNIDILHIEINKIAILIFGTLFISTIVITIGIFKEFKNIQKGVLNFGIISEIIYITYLYILNVNIYRYIIYILALIAFLIINLKKDNEQLRRIMFIIFFLVGLLEILGVLI